MTSPTKLRDVIARAVDPRQYISCPNKPEHEKIANREIYSIADRILAALRENGVVSASDYRHMLLKTNGCLGLLLGGANPKGPAYRETYDAASALLDKGFSEEWPTPPDTGSHVKFIKILKCSDPFAWYANFVGSVFPVEIFEMCLRPSQGIPESVYWCREGGAYNPLNYVRASDAEPILLTQGAGRNAVTLATGRLAVSTANDRVARSRPPLPSRPFSRGC